MTKRIAKYKEKKTVKDKDGKDMIVYEYSDRQVNKRHKEKSEKVEKIRKTIGDLESQVLKDLKKEDTRQVALAVALINHTYERVGNDESASNGHYGVTGWKKKHLSFKGSKAVLSYTGKSGVRHTKEVDDKALVSALRDISKGKKGDEELLSDIKAPDVNKYLDQFGVTAKDIRGYHANREMQDRLKALRQENGELPKDKKEKEQILKDEFKEALKGAAKAVGHEEATLRGQYLVPHLEETYMKDGTVITTLKKARINRIASMIFGTKSDSQREDEEAERLVSPSPKKKPPRTDKDRRIMKTEDKDIDKDPDLKSKDTSMNYKVIGGSMGGVITRVASRYLMASRVADRHLMRQRVASRWLRATTQIVETPEEKEKNKSSDEKESDKKEKEDKKKSLVRRKEKEAWDGFVKEKIKDPESKREVSWGTFEKKYPDDAKKIRKNFRKDFAEKFESDQAEKENEQARSLDKKLTEEDMKDFDSMMEEKMDLNGREIRLPYDTDNAVRSVVYALQDKKRDDETVEEYQERVSEDIKKSIREMNTEQLQQLMDSGAIDKSDPRVNGAIDTMMSLEAMNDVVGRPMSETEAEMMADYYNALVSETVTMQSFKSDKDDSKGFIADFVTGAKDAAVEALKSGEEPDLNKVMTEHMKGITTTFEKNEVKIRELTKGSADPKAMKELEKARAEVEKQRGEAQKQMDALSDINEKLAGKDISEEKREELNWEQHQLERSVEKSKATLDKAKTEFDKMKENTTPSPEALKKALTDMVAPNPKDSTEMKKRKKDLSKAMKDKDFDSRSALLELSKAEKIDKYKEIIENSDMSEEDKKKALERADDPKFDPDGALAGMMSGKGKAEDEI